MVPSLSTRRCASQTRWRRGSRTPTPGGCCTGTSKARKRFVCNDGRVKLLDFGLGAPARDRGFERSRDPRVHGTGAGGGNGGRRAGGRLGGGHGAGGDAHREAAGGADADAGVEADRTELMWEAAKEPVSPGTPPALARVPRPVAKAVGVALSEDPAARPKHGGAWLSELRSARLRVERPKRIRRIAIFATAFVLVGLAVAGLATWRLWERQIPAAASRSPSPTS